MLSNYGCLASCKRAEFSWTEEEIDDDQTTTSGGGSLTLKLYYGTFRHDVREQYFLYDYNRFIADVGGFLGLLLGHSALSLVHKVDRIVVERNS